MRQVRKMIVSYTCKKCGHSASMVEGYSLEERITLLSKVQIFADLNCEKCNERIILRWSLSEFLRLLLDKVENHICDVDEETRRAHSRIDYLEDEIASLVQTNPLSNPPPKPPQDPLQHEL